MCGVSKKPSFEKLWREKANMQMSWSSAQAVFAHFLDQRKAGTTRRATGQSIVASLLPTGVNGVKQARYRRRPTRGSEVLVRACAVYTQR